MKKIITMCLGIIYAVIGYSQVLTIKDKATQQALEMASIASENPKVFSISDIRGHADISLFKNAAIIEIRLLGYKTERKSYAELEQLSFNILLTQSGLSLDEVVISATRWRQSSRDVPGKISSISTKEVRLQNPQTAADLLAVSGKVFLQKSQQGGGSPMIRGFSTNRLLYSVDGVRMNTAIFRSGNLQNVISLDPFATEKTEVFFGPGSVIYGSDAIGGVMSFVTLNPRLSMDDKPLITGKALTRYSSANNEMTGHFDVNVANKKWSSVSSFSSYDFGDLRMGSKGPDEYLRHVYVQRQDSTDVIITNDDPRVQVPTGYSQINLMQKVRFKPNENWDFVYAFHFSETSEYSRYDRHIRYRNGLPRYGEWNYGPQKWMMNNLAITHQGQNKLYDELNIRLAIQNFGESRIDRDINKNERHVRTEDVDAYSANFDFNKSIGTKHKLYYGLEAVMNDVTSIGIDEDISTGIKAEGPSRYPQSTWASYAAYLNYQLKVSEKILVQAGARYNQYSMESEFDTTFYPFPYTSSSMNQGALTGSLGLIYRPTEKWVLSTNLSTGFRAPNVDDAGKVFDSEPGSVVVPNPDLTAEYAYSFDLEIAKVFGEIVKVELSGYYTVLQDALVRRDYQLNGMDSIDYDGTLSQVQAIQNAAVATVYGIQAGLEVKSKSGIGFSTDFNYQIGEEEVDDGTKSPSRHAPPWFGTTRLNYSVNKFDLQLYATYCGEKKFEDLPQEEQGKTEIYAIDQNGNPYSPSWYTLNFKCMYHFADNFTVSAGIENLTDQRYRPYSSGIVAAERNFVISLLANF
ncbi:MAG: TonB-dependent receptor [Bacteroidia bacterium]|nr:TonB-dependent receptor [Bacteroidia bacterium]